jgi:hypothetical protein
VVVEREVCSWWGMSILVFFSCWVLFVGRFVGWRWFGFVVGEEVAAVTRKLLGCELRVRVEVESQKAGCFGDLVWGNRGKSEENEDEALTFLSIF